MCVCDGCGAGGELCVDRRGWDGVLGPLPYLPWSHLHQERPPGPSSPSGEKTKVSVMPHRLELEEGQKRHVQNVRLSQEIQVCPQIQLHRLHPEIKWIVCVKLHNNE